MEQIDFVNCHFHRPRPRFETDTSATVRFPAVARPGDNFRPHGRPHVCNKYPYYVLDYSLYITL